MKLKLIVALALVCNVSSAQDTYRFDRNGNLIDGSHIQLRNLGEVVLKDSAGTRYILDSVHVSIAAYDASGKKLWHTDPWKDANLPEYRTKRPVIVRFRLTASGKNMKIESISIVYNNTQFGIVNKATGNFEWFGQN